LGIHNLYPAYIQGEIDMKKLKLQSKTGLWHKLRIAVLALLGGAAAGCAGQNSYGTAYNGPVYVASTSPRVSTNIAALGLQACADHAAAAQKAVADDFRVLRFDSERLVALPVQETVGSQAIAGVYDGYGARYSAKEYRLVNFHCLQNPAGQIVYSFVRAQ
jgi:hypothetical protein